jgi:ribose 1,5-bisphosphokinase
VAAGASSSGMEPGDAAGIGPGAVVLIVGPSGAGKDTLLRLVRERLAGDDGFSFPRRAVTRPADTSEDHASLSWRAFEEEIERGAFALHWQAHGHGYGIPAAADAAVRAGRTVVFNASRQVIPAARRRYAATVVLVVDAPVEVRAARLAARDRESAEEVLARLQRVVAGFHLADADLVVDNGGAPEPAAELIVSRLQDTRG